jgi:hypothetical protein
MTLARTLFLLSALTACGADGEPVQPTMNAGLSVGTGGVRVGGGVGVSQGPVSLFFGF